MEQVIVSARHEGRFFDFNMIDQSKSNFRKSKKNQILENGIKIDFLRAAIINNRKID